MQNKLTIKVLIALVSLVCLYELSFTYFTKQVEKEARESSDSYQEYQKYLKDQQDEEIWLGYTYQECKKREINLGLDLRGGVSVTLEISMEELLRSMAGENAQKVDYKKVESRAKELQTESQEPYVDLFYQAYQEVGPKRPFVTWFVTRDNDDFTLETPDEEVLETLRQYSNDAINQANQVLRERVKQFGVAQPDIRKLGNTGRIMVDLPGVKNIKRVRKLLQGSANLEFYDVFNMGLIQEELSLAAEVYGELYAPEDSSASKDTTKGDSAAIFDAVQPDAFSNPFLEARLGGYPYFMIVPLKDTAQVNTFVRSERAKKIFSDKIEFAWDSKAESAERGDYVRLYTLQKDRYGKPLMSGDIIKYANADYDPESGQKIVSLDFKSSYVKQWEDISRASMEEQKPIVIVLDGVVYSTPVASSVIANGRTMITGGAGDNQYWNQDLANVLNAGKFPAPAKIVEESLVGPTLGDEAIQAGVLSFAIALIVVLIYMMFYYSTAGWVSNVALLANIFFIIGALAAAPTISLTLPGVAGIVLTVGMSVDANVLIYERIREELRTGKSVRLAIADGYSNAYTAILDANITTLITGIILWYFGTGVIESFAQTLVIGIFTSLFSAIFITRLIFEWLLSKEKKISFSTNVTENLFSNINRQFVLGRRKFYLLSAGVIVVGLVSIFTKGFDLGTDFSGGRTYKVKFENPVSENEVRSALAKQFIGPDGKELVPEVKSVGNGSSLIITTKYKYNESGKNVSSEVESKLFEGISTFLPADMTFVSFTSQEEGKTAGLMQSYTVGPTIADDIIDAAITSIIIALIAIFAYVAIRFRKWQFGMGALIAIFHDVLIVLGLFSLLSGWLPFSLEINQAFVAAILTVVGYSINDTVVVFDRIREVILRNKSYKTEDTVNVALNSTLSRTFNTSITIVVVLLAILIFGGETIQGFAFALLVGVIVGTYSSLCIATPVYYDLVNKDDK
jgi:SecD/SecF fusion protein